MPTGIRERYSEGSSRLPVTARPPELSQEIEGDACPLALAEQANSGGRRACQHTTIDPARIGDQVKSPDASILGVDPDRCSRLGNHGYGARLRKPQPQVLILGARQGFIESANCLEQ